MSALSFKSQSPLSCFLFRSHLTPLLLLPMVSACIIPICVALSKDYLGTGSSGREGATQGTHIGQRQRQYKGKEPHSALSCSGAQSGVWAQIKGWPLSAASVGGPVSLLISAYWQSSFPCSCRTEGPVSLLGVSRGLFTLSRGHFHFLVCDHFSPSSKPSNGAASLSPSKVFLHLISIPDGEVAPLGPGPGG